MLKNGGFICSVWREALDIFIHTSVIVKTNKTAICCRPYNLFLRSYDLCLKHGENAIKMLAFEFRKIFASFFSLAHAVITASFRTACHSLVFVSNQLTCSDMF